MGTVPEQPEVVTRADEAESAFRNIIAGHERGAVRRILLYGVVAVGIPLITVTPFAYIPTIAALMLLALTDDLR